MPAQPHSNGNGHATNGNGKTNGHANNGNGNGKTNGHNSNGHADAAAGGNNAVYARNAIQAVLGSDFEFVTSADVPRVSMDHCRKFTLQCMHVLVWKFAAAQ